MIIFGFSLSSPDWKFFEVRQPVSEWLLVRKRLWLEEHNYQNYEPEVSVETTL